MAISTLLAATITVLVFSTCLGENKLVLVLEDTFEEFDVSLWRHEITLGGEGFQWYTNNRTNSYVENGVLHITPTFTEDDIIGDITQGPSLDIWGFKPASLCTSNKNFGCERSPNNYYNYINPIKSASIRTAESFSFTYGKVEIRAKLPIGEWLWPSIVLLPTDNYYGDFPRSGGITIMESRGNPPNYTYGGYDKFTSSLHWGLMESDNLEIEKEESAPLYLDEFTSNFHTYGLIWNETYIGTYLDDESNPVLQVPINESFFERGDRMGVAWNASSDVWRNRGDNAPFDRRFYLKIFLAVGGINGYFPNDMLTNKPWNNSAFDAINQFYNERHLWEPTWTQSSFEIDSIRVWTNRDPTSVENRLLQSLKDRCECV